MVSLLVVDDETIIRRGLLTTLGKQEGLMVGRCRGKRHRRIAHGRTTAAGSRYNGHQYAQYGWAAIIRAASSHR